MRHFQGQPFPLLYRGQMLLCYLPRAFWWITGISYFKHICFWNQENKETIWIHSWLSKLNIVEDHMIIKFWAHHDFTFSQPIGQHKQHIWICVDEILYALQRTKELKWLEHQFSYLWENVQKGFHKTFEILWKIFPNMNVYSVSHFQNIKWGEEGNGMKLCTGKPCISSQYTHISKRRKCSPVKWHRVTSSSWTQFCVFFGGSLRYGKYGISYNWSISENLIKALRRSLEFHKHCVCVTHFPLGDHQRGIQQIPKYIRSLTSNNFLFHRFQKKCQNRLLLFCICIK